MTVPDGWEKVKLNQLIGCLDAGVSVNSGDRPASDEERGILKTSCVSNGFFEMCENKVVLKTKEISRLKEPVIANSIIISRMNTPMLVGANAYIENCYPNLYLPDRLWQAKPKNTSTNMKWLSYVLESKHGRHLLRSRATGTSGSMKNIKKSDVLAMPILSPPSIERNEIARILSTWDSAIEVTEKLIENSERQKKALMQQLLTGKKRLKGFGGDWKLANLGAVVKISKGKQKNRSLLNAHDPIPVINGGVEPSGYADEANTSAGTITISEGGNSCGYVGYQSESFWCGGHCYALLSPKANTAYLYQALKQLESQIMRLRVGSGLPNIQKKDLSKLKIKIPRIDEQVALGELFANLDAEVNLLRKEWNKLKHEKTALMQQLLTGKRRVKIDKEIAA